MFDAVFYLAGDMLEVRRSAAHRRQSERRLIPPVQFFLKLLCYSLALRSFLVGNLLSDLCFFVGVREAIVVCL